MIMRGAEGGKYKGKSIAIISQRVYKGIIIAITNNPNLQWPCGV